MIDYKELCEYMMMCTQIIHIIGCIPVILSQLLINQGEILFREKQDLVDFVYNSVWSSIGTLTTEDNWHTVVCIALLCGENGEQYCYQLGWDHLKSRQNEPYPVTEPPPPAHRTFKVSTRHALCRPHWIFNTVYHFSSKSYRWNRRNSVWPTEIHDFPWYICRIWYSVSIAMLVL